MAIGTGTALLLGAGAGLIGSSMQSKAAKSAAGTQAAAADRAADALAHRGSFSYCRRSLRVASRAEMIRTLAVSGPVAV